MKDEAAQIDGSLPLKGRRRWKWPTFLQRFKRVTSSGRYMPEVDGLRFVAIFAVLCFHAHMLFFDGGIPEGVSLTPSWDWLSWAMGHGWYGVQVFFVISGFVLGLPFAAHYLKGKKPVPMKQYYLRRLFRIEFPYLIALTGGLLLQWLGWSGHELGATECLQRFGAGLIYMHSLMFDGQLNPLLHVSWTLEIEIQFYLIAPILCMVYKISPTWLRRGVLVASLWLAHYVVNENLHVVDAGWWQHKHNLLGQLPYFLAGLLLADIYIGRSWQENPTRDWRWDVVGIPAWLFVPFALRIPEMDRLMSYLLIIGFVAALRGKWLRRLLSQPLLAAIGGMCYSIYLFHGAILYWLAPNLVSWIFPYEKDDFPYALLPLGLSLSLTIILCSLLYLVIEKPSMSWGVKKK